MRRALLVLSSIAETVHCRPLATVHRSLCKAAGWRRPLMYPAAQHGMEGAHQVPRYATHGLCRVDTSVPCRAKKGIFDDPPKPAKERPQKGATQQRANPKTGTCRPTFFGSPEGLLPRSRKSKQSVCLCALPHRRSSTDPYTTLLSLHCARTRSIPSTKFPLSFHSTAGGHHAVPWSISSIKKAAN